ncbi:hypothetical protein ONZ45_g4706 [Pleurotus djamor]|nr:hypothetical protein ONZ45_g4706 [Pleurotus djamor]
MSDALLPQIGRDFIIKAVRVAIGAVCYGAYLLLFGSSTSILLRRGWRSVSSMVLFLLTTIMFLGCTMFFIIDLSDIIYRFKILLIENPDETYEERLAQADTKLQGFVWAGEMLFIFLLILGDSIVLWRTWALYKHRYLPIVVPSLTWIGSVIAAFYELGCDAKFGWILPDTRPSASSVGIESCAKADTASFKPGTPPYLRLGEYLPSHFVDFRLYPFITGATVRIEKIMFLLVESGAIYLALYTFQAVPIYGGSFNPRTEIAVQAANAVIQQAMGMYPTAIVVLVQLQKTVWDTPEMNHAISVIDFAHRSNLTGASQLENALGSSVGLGSDGSDTATSRSKDNDEGKTIEIRKMASSRSFVAWAK